MYSFLLVPSTDTTYLSGIEPDKTRLQTQNSRFKRYGNEKSD